MERAAPWDASTHPNVLGRERRRERQRKKTTADKARPRGCWEEEQERSVVLQAAGGCGGKITWSRGGWVWGSQLRSNSTPQPAPLRLSGPDKTAEQQW